MALAALLVPLPTDGQAVDAAVVQGNVPQTGLDAFGQRAAVLNNHVDATRQLAEQVAAGTRTQPELVVWPEPQSDGPRYVIRVADGTAEVRTVGGPVDCVISADPVTYLLVVYGRMPLGRALLRGGMLAWGRRPWLGLRFKDLFFNP